MAAGEHFISGMPRSGSTLLSAILRQNPLLHAGMSSPAGPLLQAVQQALGPQAEFADQISPVQRRSVLRAAFSAFYEPVAAGKVVLDTNRRWCARMPLIAELFPESKVVACVRDLVWVMDSLERINRRDGLVRSKMFGPKEDATVYTRCEALMSPNGVVGMPWGAVHEAFYGEHSDRLILVDYESLTTDPAGTVGRVYAHLGLEPFDHDFERVEYTGGDGFDANLGLPGLHAVRPRVEHVERDTVLPPELHNRYVGRCFWRGPDAAARKVNVVSPPPKGRFPARRA